MKYSHKAILSVKWKKLSSTEQWRDSGQRWEEDQTERLQTIRGIHFAAKPPLRILRFEVQLSCTAKGKGKISIPFNNEEDLERIMEILDSLKKKE